MFLNTIQLCKLMTLKYIIVYHKSFLVHSAAYINHVNNSPYCIYVTVHTGIQERGDEDCDKQGI